LGTIIPVAPIIIIVVIIIWLKQGSLKNVCCVRISPQSSSDNPNGLSKTVLELNRVAPA